MPGMVKFKGVEIRKMVIHSDPRGSLWKLAQAGFDRKFKFGETYLTLARPGAWRAGHYHERIREWFIVLKGKAKFRFYHMDTKKRMEIMVRDRDHLRLGVDVRVAHGFKNMGKGDLLVLAVASLCYNPKDPDTYAVQEAAFGS